MIVFVFVTPVKTAIMTCSGELDLVLSTYLDELRGHVSNILAQMVRGHWVTKSSKAITTGSKSLI